MRHPNVTEAFAILIAELETALKTTRQAAATASQRGNYDEAQTHLNEARQIEKFVAEVRGKQREWNALFTKRRCKPATTKSRLPPGKRTPGAAYRLPILRALVAMGGEAKMHAVLDHVYQEIKHRLTPADLEPLPSDANTPRWRNTAQWARLSLVQEGLLRNDSPRGIWAITDKGRAYLATHSG